MVKKARDLSPTLPLFPMQSPLNDQQIQSAFQGTNFGTLEYRALLAHTLLKMNVGQSAGHTITMVCRRLGLTDAKDRLTQTGDLYIYAHFFNPRLSG